MQITARENRTQNSEMKKALEMNRLAVHSLQKKFDEMQVEQKELTLQNELLEQQVSGIQRSLIRRCCVVTGSLSCNNTYSV